MTIEERTRLIQQIPVFALRQLLTQRFTGEEDKATLTGRVEASLGSKPQKLPSFISRLTRLELTTLINACPELDDALLLTTFEEYRYGSHPSFYIFLFDPRKLREDLTSDLAARLNQALVDDNERFALSDDGSLPRVRDLTLDGFTQLPVSQEIFEGSYRFLSRLDYIDAEQNAVSTYETLYGFFWIGVSDGFVTIHARKPEVLRSLKSALEEAAGVFLTPLVISKQFKNALAFLDRREFRSSCLYEPDPTAPRFRRLTISDRRAYEKNYEEFEASYPELRSTKYRVRVGDKDTSLNIRCDQGALSLAGRLRANEFRAWATESLGEVLRVIGEIQATPAEYVQTAGLRQSPALAVFRTAAQKDLLLSLLSDVLTLKREGKETMQLTSSPLDLAFVFGADLPVQWSAVCQESDCQEEGFFVCPVCDSSLFVLTQKQEDIQIECLVQSRHWQVPLPVDGLLTCGHSAVLSLSDIPDHLELLPGSKLLSVMARLVNNHLREYQFDPLNESFFIRGTTLYYYPNKDLLLGVISTDPRKMVHFNQVNQNINKLFGTAVGVNIESKQ